MRQNGRWHLTDFQRLLVVLTGAVAVFIAAMALGLGSLVLGGIALLLVVLIGLVVFLLGLRYSSGELAEGEARVLSAPPPPPGKIVSRCDLRLQVHLPGQPVTVMRHRDPSVPLTKWPRLGTVLPVDLNPRTRSLRVRWDRVEPHGKEPATVVATTQVSAPPATPVPPPEVPFFIDYVDPLDGNDGFDANDGFDGATGDVAGTRRPRRVEPQTTIVLYDYPDFPQDPPARPAAPEPRPPDPRSSPDLGPAPGSPGTGYPVGPELAPEPNPGSRSDGPRSEDLPEARGEGRPPYRSLGRESGRRSPWLIPEPPAEPKTTPSDVDGPTPTADADPELRARAADYELPMRTIPQPRPAEPPTGPAVVEPGSRGVEPRRDPRSVSGDAGAGGMGIMLVVSDLGRSVRFYQDLVGLTVVDQAANTAVLSYGGGRVVLRQLADMSPVDRRVSHLHIAVPDVERAYRDLVAKGVQFVHVPRAITLGDKLDLWAATFRDPDGHDIALTQWRDKNATY